MPSTSRACHHMKILFILQYVDKEGPRVLEMFGKFTYDVKYQLTKSDIPDQTTEEKE
jgi:hypothetical protein